MSLIATITPMLATPKPSASTRPNSTFRPRARSWNAFEIAAIVGVLVWTALLSLTWSHLRLMWNDEFLSFYTDSLPSAAQVIHVQRYTPISLDPPTYHLLSHLSMRLAGQGPVALRLPALAGFLLCQVCLFFLIRTIASYRAALFAMVLPVLTASFRYSVEGRPYAWLLGLYALALLCWYRASETGVAGRSRTPQWVWLVGLFAALLLAITSHYFGVLILLPFALAELARTVRRRAVDWPMIATLCAGAGSVALILPFQKGLAPYRRHYYITSVSFHAIPRGYRDLFLQDDRVSNTVQRIFAVAFVIAVGWILLRAVRSVRKSQQQGRFTPARFALLTALLTLAALPLFGFLMGRFVTHTMEERYVIASLIPFVIAVAIALRHEFQKNKVFYPALAVVLLVGTGATLSRLSAEKESAHRTLSKLNLSPEVVRELALHPSERLFVQNTNELFLGSYYAPSQLVRQRLTAIYDGPQEVQILGNDTDAVTAVNLSRFQPFSTVAFRDFIAQPATLLLYNQKAGMDWVGIDLNQHRVPMYFQGKALGSDVFRVEPDHHVATATR